MSSIDLDLVRLLKRLKLGQLVPTLAERLTLARAQQLDYVAFLTLLLADEVQRRDQQALERHLVQAGFEDRVTLDGFDWTSPVQLDRRQLQQVFTLEFLARKEHAPSSSASVPLAVHSRATSFALPRLKASTNAVAVARMAFSSCPAKTRAPPGATGFGSAESTTPASTWDQ